MKTDKYLFILLLAGPAMLGCGGSAAMKDGGNATATDASKTDGHSDAGGSKAGGGGNSGISKDGGGGSSGASDAGIDARSTDDAGVVPTNLTATVLDRRQTSFRLGWTAPTSDTGGKVAGYDVRVAKQVITEQNFDDTTVTLTVAYSGTIASPGLTDGTDVKNLNIEQAYYFAIAGKDSSGTRGPIAATATAVQSEFQTTVLSGAGTDGIGEDLDGSGDFGTASNLSFTADGYSDLIVGGAGGRNVYVFFGTPTGYSSSPGLTISGSVTNFGKAVVNAGDLDGDGLSDIAIASPDDGGGGKVYIFSRKNPPASWGTTGKWPATLTDFQANYVLSADATYAGGTDSIQPHGMARLGNFDGTGADDLAVGFALHSSAIGSLLIIKGSSSFASMAIPDSTNVKTIEIDGTVTGGLFGYATVGIGQFFATPADPVLLTSGPGASLAYAFTGQSPTGVLTAAAANDSVTGVPANVYGLDLAFLGPLGVSPGALIVGDPNAGYVDVFLGTAAKGPLLGGAGGLPAASLRVKDAAAGNSFGGVNIGGGIKGTSQEVSFIGGDAISDLVLAGQAETGSPIYIVNGTALSSLTGSLDVSTARTEIVPPIVKILNRLPAGWGGYAGTSLIVDANKDGYGDFAIGEFATGAAGRVVVFY